MDTPTSPSPTHETETFEERGQRLAWEQEMIEEALQDLAAGRLVSERAVAAWIDSLDTDHELPLPQSGR